jgi:hypothetical protein
MTPNRHARHVIKFEDGDYLGPSYTERTRRQWDACRFLTWASAKLIAESPALTLVGPGARAVRLIPVAWCALGIDGGLVLLGSTRAEAKKIVSPRVQAQDGTRIVKYVPDRSKKAYPL